MNQARLAHPLESLFVTTTTICNLHCVFCAYPKSNLKRQLMPRMDFETHIEAAVQFGYHTFNLTPLVGEPLADPFFLERLRFLENHPGILDYYFSTNLTLADDTVLETLSQLKKLRWLSISLYGQDEDAFQKLTHASPEQYQNLLGRLRELRQHPPLLNRTGLKIRDIQIRTSRKPPSELQQLVKQLQEQGVQVRIPGGLSNWSGMVDTRKMKELGLLTRPDEKPASGPCAFIFKPVVLPDGRVNACAVGDGNARLIIGDLKRTGFKEILSSSNPLYHELIQAHLGPSKPAVCQQCTAFRGIHTEGFSYSFHNREPLSLEGMLEWLDGNARRNTGSG